MADMTVAADRPVAAPPPRRRSTRDPVSGAIAGFVSVVATIIGILFLIWLVLFITKGPLPEADLREIRQPLGGPRRAGGRRLPVLLQSLERQVPGRGAHRREPFLGDAAQFLRGGEDRHQHRHPALHLRTAAGELAGAGQRPHRCRVGREVQAQHLDLRRSERQGRAVPAAGDPPRRRDGHGAALPRSGATDPDRHQVRHDQGGRHALRQRCALPRHRHDARQALHDVRQPAVAQRDGHRRAQPPHGPCRGGDQRVRRGGHAAGRDLCSRDRT